MARKNLYNNGRKPGGYSNNRRPDYSVTALDGNEGIPPVDAHTEPGKVREVGADVFAQETAGRRLGAPGKKSIGTEQELAAKVLDSKGEPVVVGYAVDKDGNYLASKNEKGELQYGAYSVKKPDDKAQLSDIGDGYVDAVKSDPRFQDALARIKAMFGKDRDEPWKQLQSGEPENVQRAVDGAAASDNFNARYGSFYEKLTALHMSGGYDKQYDSMGPFLDARDAVRADMAKQNPEMDTAMANTARHWMNTQDKMLEQGCDFQDCEFVDKNGKVLSRPEPGCSQAEFEQYTRTMVYAMDHGMIGEVRGKDGRALTGLPVQDAYTANLDYYDSHAGEIAKYTSDLHNKTAERAAEVAKAHENDHGHPRIAGCEITGTDNAAYYADAKEHADAHAKVNQGMADSYEAGKNPYLEAMKSYGYEDKSQPQAAQPGVHTPDPNKEASIARAMQAYENVKMPEADAEYAVAR